MVVDRLLLQQQLIEGEERRAAKRTASDSKTDGAPSKEALLATAMARDAVGTLSSGIASAPPPLLRGASPISPLHLPYISPTSPLYLPYISPNQVDNFVALRFARKLQAAIRRRKGTLGEHATPALNAAKAKVFNTTSMLGHRMGIEPSPLAPELSAWEVAAYRTMFERATYESGERLTRTNILTLTTMLTLTLTLTTMLSLSLRLPLIPTLIRW